MLTQLLLALILTTLTVVIHAVGMVRVVTPLSGIWRRNDQGSESIAVVIPLVRLVSGLLLLHLIEMAIWAAAFAAIGVLPDFETALYYSLKSYTTVGYGDVLPPATWRLVGPIEAAVGVLMLGLSTGVIVAAVQRIYNSRLETM
jgi:voltage-gated potassium channel